LIENEDIATLREQLRKTFQRIDDEGYQFKALLSKISKSVKEFKLFLGVVLKSKDYEHKREYFKKHEEKIEEAAFKVKELG